MRLHAIVHGLVQGVCFRAYTQLKASEFGISGWVRNLPNDCVEVIAEGEKKQLELLLSWLHSGPSSAEVEKVEEKWEKASGEFSGFQIRH